MWISVKEQVPGEKEQGGYKVYGLWNKGSEYEAKGIATAYWHGKEYGWKDGQGDDLTGINESVTHWYDFSQVAPPEDA